MHVKYGVLGIGLALCLIAGVSVANSAVQWQPTLDRAQVVAAHSNRLVLIHFWGNGCSPCAWMDREVFTRPDVAQAIDRGFVAVKINKDQFPNIASQFGVAAVPTDVIITSQGQILGSHVGKAPATDFINRLSQIAQRAAPPAGQQYPVQSRGPVNQPPAYGQNYAQQGPQMQQPLANGGYAPSGPPSFAQQGASSGQAAQVIPRYSGDYGMAPNPPLAANQSTAPFNSNVGQEPAVGPPRFAANSYPPNPNMPHVDPMAQQFAAQSQSPSQQTVAAPANGNPPLALDGFCAVSLERSMRLDPQPKWIPGDPTWGARHEGRTYLFAGPEEQQAFFNNPHIYAPVLSGNDAVLQVEQSWQVQGVREFGARWRDRVYLFSSRENFEKFQANPTFYENEILGSQQTVAGPAGMPAPHVGTSQTSPYGYR